MPRADRRCRVAAANSSIAIGPVLDAALAALATAQQRLFCRPQPLQHAQLKHHVRTGRRALPPVPLADAKRLVELLWCLNDELGQSCYVNAAPAGAPPQLQRQRCRSLRRATPCCQHVKRLLVLQQRIAEAHRVRALFAARRLLAESLEQRASHQTHKARRRRRAEH